MESFLQRNSKVSSAKTTNFIILFIFFQIILILTSFFIQSNYLIYKAEIISVRNINTILKEVLFELDKFENNQISTNYTYIQSNYTFNIFTRLKQYFTQLPEISLEDNTILIGEIIKKHLKTRFKREIEFNDSSFRKKSTRVKKNSSTTNSLTSTPIQEYFYIPNKNLTNKETKELNNVASLNNDHFLIQAYSKISVKIYLLIFSDNDLINCYFRLNVTQSTLFVTNTYNLARANNEE